VHYNAIDIASSDHTKVTIIECMSYIRSKYGRSTYKCSCAHERKQAPKQHG
jgi:hypothetical protein